MADNVYDRPDVFLTPESEIPLKLVQKKFMFAAFILIVTVAVWPGVSFIFGEGSVSSSTGSAICGEPQLGITSTDSYWESYSAFRQRQLTVDFRVTNDGGISAKNLIVVNVSNSSGVVTVDSYIASVVAEQISPAAAADFPIMFQVPQGVATFTTRINATVEDSCGTTYQLRDDDSERPDWYRPPLNVTWHWQLSGDVNPTNPVDIYDIDLFDSSVTLIDSLKSSGKQVICYFSAGSFENWRPDASQFSQAELGNALAGWSGEKWLDIRSANVRRIMERRLDLARQKGCSGVEPDNVDGYANESGFGLSAGDQLSFNRFIADAAHARSLSVGLKNDLDQVSELVDYFDFSINEQCHEFDECMLLAPFVRSGKPVLNAEYEDELMANPVRRQSLCDAAIAEQFSTLILPLELDDSFRFSCSE